MSFVKRNRIVSIRVTQEEYQTLERVSRRQGANSVSEYLRLLLRNAAPVAAATKRETRGVAYEIDYLKQELDRLSHLVEVGYGHLEPSGGDLARKVAARRRPAHNVDKS